MTASASSATTGSALSANLLCMLSMLIWAAALPAADLIIPLLFPEQLNALRMAMAALAMLPFWLAIEGWAPLRRVNWLKGIAVGSLIGLGAWFLILGQAQSGPVTVALTSATMPLVGIAIEVMLDGRRITWGLVIGLSLSLAGGFVALDFGSGGPSLGLGVLYCLASVLSFVIGSRLTVTAFPEETPLGRTTITLIGAAIAAGAVLAFRTALGLPIPSFDAWGWPEAGALVLYSVGALGISQLLWIMAVGRIGIGFTALHMNATPFYVMLILFAAGGSWNWTQAFAAAIVGLGVLVAQGMIALPLGRKT